MFRVPERGRGLRSLGGCAALPPSVVPRGMCGPCPRGMCGSGPGSSTPPEPRVGGGFGPRGMGGCSQRRPPRTGGTGRVTGAHLTGRRRRLGVSRILEDAPKLLRCSPAAPRWRSIGHPPVLLVGSALVLCGPGDCLGSVAWRLHCVTSDCPGVLCIPHSSCEASFLSLMFI